MPEPMRIKTIEVKGLFGRFNHTVNLNLEERVTILHGPNGVGKTVLLKMVQAALTKASGIAHSFRFDDFAVEGTKGEKLRINSELIFRSTENFGPTPLPPCHLIETQRLLRVHRSSLFSESAKIFERVVDCEKDLADYIRQHMSHYGRRSQELDQTFPQRMVKKKLQPLPVAELKKRLLALEAKQKGLMDLGLLDKTVSPPFDPTMLDDLDEAGQRVMSVYVDDMGEKLKVLDEAAQRCKLLLDCVNQKFRHKRIVLDQEAGFQIQGARGKAINSSALSSGEQHEIVLLYDLLFGVEPGSLVLIDEPELSLHVSWQKQFVPDLLAIAKAVGIDVVLATHSPFIVGDRLDLTVALNDEEAAA